MTRFAGGLRWWRRYNVGFFAGKNEFAAGGYMDHPSMETLPRDCLRVIFVWSRGRWFDNLCGVCRQWRVECDQMHAEAVGATVVGAFDVNYAPFIGNVRVSAGDNSIMVNFGEELPTAKTHFWLMSTGWHIHARIRPNHPLYTVGVIFTHTPDDLAAWMEYTEISPRHLREILRRVIIRANEYPRE